MRIGSMLASAAVAAVLMASGAAGAKTYVYDFSTDQEYGRIAGSMRLAVDAAGDITGGSAALTGGGLSGTVDFNVVATPRYCGGSCYGWRSGGGTDFYGFTNSYSGRMLNDVVLASSSTSGTGYTFGVYSNGPGGYQNGVFGPGAAPNFYSYNVPITLTSIPEPATWAMLALGFAGLGLAGYHKARAARAIVV